MNANQVSDLVRTILDHHPGAMTPERRFLSAKRRQRTLKARIYRDGLINIFHNTATGETRVFTYDGAIIFTDDGKHNLIYHSGWWDDHLVRLAEEARDGVD